MDQMAPEIKKRRAEYVYHNRGSQALDPHCEYSTAAPVYDEYGTWAQVL